MPDLTLGVEEEYMIIDPKSLELSSETGAMLGEAEDAWGDNVKPEFHTAVVEVITDVCADLDELGDHLRDLRRKVIGIAEKHDLLIGAAGTHPSTHWKDVVLTSSPRYSRILNNLQDIARANLIYGMHCHVGIEDPEARIHIMNAARYFLPHFLALSSSSPMWQGKPTGHMSTRTHIFKRFPRTGVPDYFADHDEYLRYVDLLVKTGSIDNAKMIYWDIRPHPFYPTIEFRVCDVPTRVEETLGIVAFFQAVVHKLLDLYQNDLGHRLYRRALINENVYRAARYGLTGNFIDFQKRIERPSADVILEVCEFLRPDFQECGTEDYIEVIEALVRGGSSAQRQIACFETHNDAARVTQQIIEETSEGL